MEFLPSSKLCHAERLCSLIQKNSEPLEDAAIASLQAEIEIKNTTQYSAGTTCDFRRKKKVKRLMTILL